MDRLSSVPGTPAERPTFLPRLLVGLLALEALGVLAIWAASLRAGAFTGGLFAYQLEGTIPFFHVTAELGMAAVALIGAVGWLRGRRWSTPVLTFAAGMLTYGAVNSMGWAVHNDVIVAVPMVVTLGTAAWWLGVRVQDREGSR